MIPYISLKDIWRITMRRSTLIPIPNLIEFFEFNNEFSKWEVFYGIVRDALDTFQKYYPLYMQQHTYLRVDNNFRAKVRGNFDAYLKGIITEDQIFLLPGAVIGLSSAPAVGTSYPIRNFHYEVGEFFDFFYTSQVWYMACLCYRPFPEEFVDGEPSANCNVYWMNKDNDVEFKIFKDCVYVELCRYIYTMKQNMQLQNLPIEVFQGLQEDGDKVRSDLDSTFTNALTASPWLL